MREPREIESKLQIWDSDPIPSESRIWPDEDANNFSILVHELFPMKTCREGSSLNFFFEGASKRMLSRLAAQRISETKILRVSLKARRVRDTLQCGPGNKGVQTPDVVLISELRKSVVMYGSEDSGGLSLKDASLGKLESMCKRSFTPRNGDSRCKGSSGQAMKGGHKEGTQKKESPLCCIDGHELVRRRRFFSLRSLVRTTDS